MDKHRGREKITPELEKIIREEIEQSEQTRDEPMPEGVVGRKRGPSTVYSIRLRPEKVEQIEAAARRLDIPASALVRGWVLAGLAEANEGSVTSTIDRLEAEVRKLRSLVA